MKIISFTQALAFLIVTATLIGSSAQAFQSLLNDDVVTTINDSYYAKPYPDNPGDPRHVVKRNVNGKMLTVWRPNHGIAHGTRQAALAYDAVHLLLENSPNPSAPRTKLVSWIKQFIDPAKPTYNANFLEQLAFGMLMYRTGRPSEDSNVDRIKMGQTAAQYFEREAGKTGYFPKQSDIQDFSFALEAATNPSLCFDGNEKFTTAKGCSTNRYHLTNFLYAVHHADLERVPGFDIIRIQRETATYLGLNKAGKPDENAVEVLKLLELARKYHSVTGDLHMRYTDRFLELSNNPPELRRVVEAVNPHQPISAPSVKPVLQPVTTKPTPMIQWSAEFQSKTAEAHDTDVFYKYRIREELSKLTPQSPTNPAGRYTADMITAAKARRFQSGTHLPWSYRSIGSGPKGLFTLRDAVPDRIFENKTEKRYVKMYHGTTSEFTDLFKTGGASAVKFDIGGGYMGAGMYMTADINEAKAYACQRRNARDPSRSKGLKAILLVFGVDADAPMKGAINDPRAPASTAAGDSIDKDVSFVRNDRRIFHNQFNFFSQATPYMRLFAVITLPDGFKISPGDAEGDGNLFKNQADALSCN